MVDQLGEGEFREDSVSDHPLACIMLTAQNLLDVLFTFCRQHPWKCFILQRDQGSPRNIPVSCSRIGKSLWVFSHDS